MRYFIFRLLLAFSVIVECLHRFKTCEQYNWFINKWPGQGHMLKVCVMQCLICLFPHVVRGKLTHSHWCWWENLCSNGRIRFLGKKQIRENLLCGFLCPTGLNKIAFHSSPSRCLAHRKLVSLTKQALGLWLLTSLWEKL